jgi:biofilm PGA synthesis protein PgaA
MTVVASHSKPILCRLGLAASIAIAFGGGASCRATDIGTAVASTSRETLMTQARELQTRGRRIEALSVCQALLRRWPDDTAAQRLRVRLLSELGAATQSLQLARLLDPALEPEEMARLEANAAAHQTTWGAWVNENPRRPYAEADRAVQSLQLTADHYGERVPGLEERLAADRLMAYAQAQRNADAAREFDRMRQSGQAVPAYAKTAAASALLEVRRPEAAIPLFEQAVRDRPGVYAESESDPRVGLMYAYLEAGRVKDALALIDSMASSQPGWLPSPGSSRPVPNSHRSEAELSAAQARLYLELLADASRRVEGLVSRAPANATYWREWGKVQRARGWPRKSEDADAIAAGLDPQDMDVRLGAIDAWREVGDFAQVEPTLRDVEEVMPRDRQVIEARREWDRQRGWQFDLEHARGQGGATRFGNDDHETQATLQSPLFDDHWRVYALAQLADASLEEGHAQRDRAGLGTRFYMRDLEAYMQLLPGVGGQAHGTAWESGLRWNANDYWLFGLAWSNKGDTAVPLQAGYYGVTATTWNADARWRASELTSIGVDATRSRFTDHNRRTDWQVDLQQRLHTAPFFTLDGGVEVGETRNDLSTVPYYSPSRARWATLSGRLKSALYQRYETQWRQQIDVAVGTYQERSYQTGWMASVQYGQTFTPHGGHTYSWSIGWASQPYEGRRESRVTLDLKMHWGE